MLNLNNSAHGIVILLILFLLQGISFCTGWIAKDGEDFSKNPIPPTFCLIILAELILFIVFGSDLIGKNF